MDVSAVGRVTPNGWSLERLKDILVDRADATTLLVGTTGAAGRWLLLLFFHTAARMRGTLCEALTMKNAWFIARKDLEYTVRQWSDVESGCS